MGNKLDFGHVLASPTNTFELALSRDPRVVEFYDIEDGGVIEFVYAPGRSVAAIYKATASQLGIKELERSPSSQVTRNESACTDAWLGLCSGHGCWQPEHAQGWP